MHNGCLGMKIRYRAQPYPWALQVLCSADLDKTEPFCSHGCGGHQGQICLELLTSAVCPTSKSVAGLRELIMGMPQSSGADMQLFWCNRPLALGFMCE